MIKSPKNMLYRTDALDEDYKSAYVVSTMQVTDKTLADPLSIYRPTNDPLGETLHLLKLKGVFYCQSELTEPWGIEIPPFDNAMVFLIITSGRCWLNVGALEPVRLERGNLALVPHGVAHQVLSDLQVEASPLFSLEVNKVSERFETLALGGGGDVTHALYGVVRFDHAAGQQLMKQLPDVLKIDTWTEEEGSWLDSTVRFISREASDLRVGGETVVTHLADILVIHAIRKWIETAPEAHQGWLCALRDDKIGRALTGIHREPGKNWTVASLARLAGMSRSAFSDRFTDLVGMTVMRYLTHWRMLLASNQLQDGSEPMNAISRGLGYQSEAAFSRAFKREFSTSPGMFRREQKTVRTMQSQLFGTQQT